MSWHARRFQEPLRKIKITVFGGSTEDLTKLLRGRITKDTMTNHHVPPRSKGWNQKDGFILRKRMIDHLSYHQLFANASSLQECIAILERDWWRKETP